MVYLATITQLPARKQVFFAVTTTLQIFSLSRRMMNIQKKESRPASTFPLLYCAADLRREPVVRQLQ